MKTPTRMPCLLACALCGLTGPAMAAENGVGFYLLGGRGPAAGITPPPGWYLQNSFYYYHGKAGADTLLPNGGDLSVGATGDAFFAAPTLLWVAPEEILDGRVGFSLTTPLGWMKSEAEARIVGSLGSREGAVSDELATYGDPIVGALIGWDDGKLHYQLGSTVNIPLGDYQEGGLANLSFNHWAADVTGAVTHLDPATGWDFSAALGLTFNAENPSTDYQTGTEMHLEGAITKHINEKLYLSVGSYFYQQVTGDSGAGATLGDFKGRVAAVGAGIGYTFDVGGTPVSAELKYFHEFAAKNRAEGDAVFLNIAVPLSLPKQSNR